MNPHWMTLYIAERVCYHYCMYFNQILNRKSRHCSGCSTSIFANWNRWKASGFSTIYWVWQYILYNNPSYVLLRFARNVFGLTCSPFFLNGTLKVHLKQFIPIESYSKFIQQLLLNLYVDDLSNSFNNVEDSLKFYEVSKKCLAESSFKLHKWATNNYELAKWIKLNESDTTEIPNADDETYVKDFLGNSYTYQKVLGVNWNATTDKFVFEFSNISTLLQN